MERRKDKNNRVLKDGESYREKEHRYMYRWIDGDKKRHCTYAQTLRELRKKEEEINRNKSDGISSAGSNLRLDDVYKLWKKNKVGLKQSTYVNYLYMYDHFIGPKIGKMKIKDIRKSTILGLYNDLTRSNDIGKTMAINTLETIHNVLRQVLQVAVDDDYIRKNPTDGVLREVKQANNYERPKRKALTLEQQNELIEKITSKPTHFTEADILVLLPDMPDAESINRLVNSTDAVFTESGLNELCDYGVGEALIKKISKQSGIPYADPDESDEEIPLNDEQPKKPGLFSSILIGAFLAGGGKPKSAGRCTGDCAHCPPHYGYRYGRWYYGHGHTEGCEFCGNGGCNGKCNRD